MNIIARIPFFILLVFFSLSLVGAGFSVSHLEHSGFRWSGWVVYWDAEDGLRETEEQEKFLEEVSVFAYHFDADDRLVPANPWVSSGVGQIKKLLPNKRVMVTFVNDQLGAAGTKFKDPHVVHRCLASDEAMQRHIGEIVELSKEADGAEIDYENLKWQDRGLFSKFVEALAAELHKNGKWLSVVVQPKVEDVLKDGPGALDWATIAAHADSVKIMAYHFHYAKGEPGPIAPPDWVKKIAKFALQSIPEEKLWIALTRHGFDWPKGTPAKSVEYDQALKIASDHKARLMHDEKTRSPYFRYKDHGVEHEVWFEDAESLKEKVQALNKAGVSRVSFWRLGTGDDAFWQ